jgi:hypothetical protein
MRPVFGNNGEGQPELTTRRIFAGRAGAVAALLTALTMIGPACGRPSEETVVKEFMIETAALAQKGDLKAVMDRLADDYVDFEGRDKAATEGLLRDYFRRTGIVIHLLSVKVDALEPDGRAALRTEAMLSSGPAEFFRRLVRYAGEYYRIGVQLTKGPSGSWRIVSAGWETVPLAELFPESLAILKKLFPDL